MIKDLTLVSEKGLVELIELDGSPVIIESLDKVSMRQVPGFGPKPMPVLESGFIDDNKSKEIRKYWASEKKSATGYIAGKPQIYIHKEGLYSLTPVQYVLSYNLAEGWKLDDESGYPLPIKTT